jgi:hypothetical protein
MFKLSFALLLVASILQLPAHAQIHGPVAGIRGRGSFPGARISANGAHGSFHRRSDQRSGQRSDQRNFYPPLLLGDGLYYADDSSQAGTGESAPQILMLPAPVANAEPLPKQASVEPLMIEWQGDRYVRVGALQKPTQPAARDSSPAVSTRSAPPVQTSHNAQPPPPDSPPTELVYRDGHHEQIRAYTIANGILYVSGDYWTDGYWTKKVELAALDLPATALASHERGAKFILPSSPAEVIMRP